MTRFIKEKVTDNVQTNINRSPEIFYWAKKYNVDPSLFQQILQENNYSIAKTIAVMHSK